MISDPISIFRNMPAMETSRLFLRQMSVDDSADMYAYASDPRVSEYLLWGPHKSQDYTRSYIAFLQKAYRKGEFYDWAVVEKESGRMIGTGGFSKIDAKNDLVEIGYVLSAAHWGKGYGSEIAAFLLRFGFEVLQCQRIEARYMVENGASRRVMEKCGMLFEGVHRKCLLVKGVYRDIGICSILREEYEKDDEKRNEYAGTNDCLQLHGGEKTPLAVLESTAKAPEKSPLCAHWYDRLRKNHGG